MALDEQLLKSTNPILQSPGIVNLNVAAQLIGLDANTLLNEFWNHRFSLYVTVENLNGHEVEDIYDVERDYDGKFVLNDVENRGVARCFTGLLRLYDSRRSIRTLIENEITTESTFLVGKTGGYFIEDELVFAKDRIQLSKKDVEFVRIKLAKSILSPSPLPSLIPTPLAHNIAASPGPIAYDPITAKYGHKKFSELFDQYKKARSWGQDTSRRMDTESRLFIELMDDPNLASIDGDMINRFAGELAKLPSDIYLAKRKLKLEKLTDLMGVASSAGFALKKPQTIKGHISKISEVLKYGVQSNMLHFNPATEFQRGAAKREFKKPQDDRGAFTESELNQIFTQSWFERGCGEFTAKGKTHWRPFYYWLPLLGLFSGGRLNELSQLYLNDIKLVDGVIHYIDFNLEGDGKIEAEDKSLKTVNSVRVVPIHRVLIELGLIEYVNALRENGETRLFPELGYDTVKGYGKAAGSWFNERFLGNKLKFERNGKKSFHSFRHTFLTAIERLNVAESVMAQLAGHEKGSTESLKRYAKDRSAQELSPIIDALNFQVITSIRAFDVNAGLKAIELAKKVKTRNQRNKQK